MYGNRIGSKGSDAFSEAGEARSAGHTFVFFTERREVGTWTQAVLWMNDRLILLLELPPGDEYKYTSKHVKCRDLVTRKTV